MVVEPEFLKKILAREFNDMDDNHDGEVDREEFKRYFGEKYKMQGKEIDVVFGDFDDQDLAHDGKLSDEEYLEFGKVAVLNY